MKNLTQTIISTLLLLVSFTTMAIEEKVKCDYTSFSKSQIYNLFSPGIKTHKGDFEHTYLEIDPKKEGFGVNIGETYQFGPEVVTTLKNDSLRINLKVKDKYLRLNTQFHVTHVINSF